MSVYSARAWYWKVGDRSPSARVYSSAARAYVTLPNADYSAWLEAGNAATVIDTEANLWEVLRDQAPGQLPDEQRYVSVATVRERLEAAKLWGAMVDALIAAGGHALLAKVVTLRWGILATDPEARGLLAQIGADAEIVLAPE